MTGDLMNGHEIAAAAGAFLSHVLTPFGLDDPTGKRDTPGRNTQNNESESAISNGK